MDQSAQDAALEARVGWHEQDTHEVKLTLRRPERLIASIHAQIPHLATKAYVERVRGDLETKIAQVRGEVQVDLAKMGGTHLGLVAAGITTGAAYLPILARAFHAGP
jgi:hypothetical protein